jgi:ParB-like chromosome segregation protein Spo0J
MEDAAKISFQRELDALQTIRDELKLKAHLAKADVKDELDRLETRWQRVEEELQRSTGHLKAPLDVEARTHARSSAS